MIGEEEQIEYKNAKYQFASNISPQIGTKRFLFYLMFNV
jgi:hypothetical protein